MQPHLFFAEINLLQRRRKKRCFFFGKILPDWLSADDHNKLTVVIWGNTTCCFTVTFLPLVVSDWQTRSIFCQGQVKTLFKKKHLYGSPLDIICSLLVQLHVQIVSCHSIKLCWPNMQSTLRVNALLSTDLWLLLAITHWRHWRQGTSLFFVSGRKIKTSLPNQNYRVAIIKHSILAPLHGQKFLCKHGCVGRGEGIEALIFPLPIAL